MHLSVGIVAGVLLTLTGLTGSMLVFGDEIDGLLNPALLQVEPRADRVPLDTIVSGIHTAFPDRPIDRIHLASEPGSSLEACFAEGQEPACVYADPYTGAQLGTRVPARSLKGRVFLFHRRLLSGAVGETIVGIEGALLIVLSASGVMLWMSGRRPIVRWPSISATTPYARRHNWHRLVGFTALPLLLLIATTGMAMVFRPTFEGTVNRLASSATPRPPTLSPAASTALPSLDAVLQTVKRTAPDAEPTYVILPASPAAPLALRARMRGEWLPKGRSFVYLDPSTGTIIRIDDARKAAPGYRAGNVLYPLHVGLLGGWPTRLMHCLVGLAPAFLCWTGTLMAWRRLFPRRGRAPRRSSAMAAQAPPRPAGEISASSAPATAVPRRSL